MAAFVDNVKYIFGKEFHNRFAPVPLTFLTLGFATDAVSGHRKFLPDSLRQMLPTSPELAIASHYANSVGLLFSLPATITGLAEITGLVVGEGKDIHSAAKGFDTSKSVDGNIERAKRIAKSDEAKILGMASLHGLLNAAMLTIGAYNWYTRRSAYGNYAQTSTNVWLSTAGLLITIVTSYLGGALVLNHGVSR